MKEIENIDIMTKEIIENFDFQKCHEMMKKTNWSWWDVGVPSVEKLKESAIERINSAAEQVFGRQSKEEIHIPKYQSQEVSYYSSSGGLKATVYAKNQKILGINLEFVFTEWCSGCD